MVSTLTSAIFVLLACSPFVWFAIFNFISLIHGLSDENDLNTIKTHMKYCQAMDIFGFGFVARDTNDVLEVGHY